VDINGDGVNDILSGCYSQRGHGVMVGSFWILRGQKDGGFAQAEELKGTDGKILMVHPGKEKLNHQERAQNTCTRPFAADWDQDGDLDIITGNFHGDFFLFTGEGPGKFAPAATQVTTADGTRLKTTRIHSDPYIIDWDRDGDLDLLATCATGEIVWARNTLDRTAPPGTAPKLAAFVTLIAAPIPRRPGQQMTGPNGLSRMHVEDVNGDGKLDILVGDRYIGGGELRADLSDEERLEYEKISAERGKFSARYIQRRNTYLAAYGAAFQEAGDLTNEEQRALYKKMVTDKLAEDEEYQAAYKALLEYNEKLKPYKVPLNRTGHVWLYTQK